MDYNEARKILREDCEAGIKRSGSVIQSESDKTAFECGFYGARAASLLCEKADLEAFIAELKMQMQDLLVEEERRMV